jgi:pSer/pThr/pTyr-binding forkhead associated (FHA) protein
MVSRRHCEIFESGGFLKIRDLGSLNGTFVRKQQIQEAELHPNDEITIGPLTFRVEYEPSVAVPPAPTADESAVKTVHPSVGGDNSSQSREGPVARSGGPGSVQAGPSPPEGSRGSGSPQVGDPENEEGLDFGGTPEDDLPASSDSPDFGTEALPLEAKEAEQGHPANEPDGNEDLDDLDAFFKQLGP